jgi:hypothetical protein
MDHDKNEAMKMKNLIPFFAQTKEREIIFSFITSSSTCFLLGEISPFNLI